MTTWKRKKFSLQNGDRFIILTGAITSQRNSPSRQKAGNPPVQTFTIGIYDLISSSLRQLGFGTDTAQALMKAGARFPGLTDAIEIRKTPHPSATDASHGRFKMVATLSPIPPERDPEIATWVEEMLLQKKRLNFPTADPFAALHMPELERQILTKKGSFTNLDIQKLTGHDRHQVWNAFYHLRAAGKLAQVGKHKGASWSVL